MGINGSGKTSIIWVIILFCRGYNASQQKSSQSKGKINLDSPQDLALLLNYNFLSSLSNYKHFLPGMQTTSEPTVISAKLGNKEFHYTLETNGSVTITPKPSDVQPHKIRFAFMGTDSSWTSPLTELDAQSPIYTSSIPNMRGRYHFLSNKYKVCLNFFN